MKSSTRKHQDDEEEETELGKSKTIVVGMKFDQESKELLTWALVKVAQPGDSVVAVHILSNSEILDSEGKSPLLALVKAFDSVLSVYEGFCNLKQVDLKLKISRGSSIRKVLINEVRSYGANKIIVGATYRKRHCIRSSVAKYLAKKLSEDCTVIGVNNGKVVFLRESNMVNNNETDDVRPTSLRFVIHRAMSRNSKVSSEAALMELNKRSYRTFGEELLRKENDCCENILKRNCSVCAPNSVSGYSDFTISTEESSYDSSVDDSLALVPVKAEERDPSPTSLYAADLIELQPGWPLLRRAILPHRKAPEGALSRKVSVVQWAMQLPNRQSSIVVVNPGPEQKISTLEDIYKFSSLDGESGAIVPVGISYPSPRSSFEESLRRLPEDLEGLHEKYSSTCRLFRYMELVRATSNFMPEKLIGKGGNSEVYRGFLPDGKELAVKILNPSEDSMKEFVLEIEIITTLHHENIISLFGFCFEDSNLLLVYDFLSRGSLEENLHGEKDRSTFGWAARYKVALGVAEALHYLHIESSQRVIHRDVKSSNILLSDDFEPQLSDFGLAKWAPTSSSHITCTDVAGTFGYMAPEYFMYGKVSEKIDVYAYGVVLLEILSGRKPINNEYPKGQESLVMWAKPILDGGKIVKLLDPLLGDNYNADQMERMALAASLCIRRAPRARPQMSTVLKLLQGDVEVTKWARQQVLTSEEFDGLEDESLPPPNMQSHLNLALLDVEYDSLSISSLEQSLSLENYLQGRSSRSSSFD